MNCKMVEYKSVLVKNNTEEWDVAIYFYHRYDPVCFVSSSSKLLSPGSSYLHRRENKFKFKIQTIYQKQKNVVVGARKWVQDTHFNISDGTTVDESNLDDHQLEKTICIRKLNVIKETSLDEGKNLYEILKLDFEKNRTLDQNKQDEEIKKAFHKELRRWHPDTTKELYDNEMILEVLAAYEVLKNHERRAEYNNKADYTKGWLSTERWGAIFWPECKTEEQIWRYRKRMVMLLMSLGICIGGIVSGTWMAACLGGCVQSSFRITNGQSIEKGCDFKDWAKCLGIGLVAGAITGVMCAEITNGMSGTGNGAVLASGGGVVFSLADDAEKKYVDGVDVTLTQAVGHAIAGACIGGITAAVVGEVAAGSTGMSANVSSTEIAEQLAPSLRSGISSKVYVDLSLTNKVSESVLGTVAGLIEERLDDKQENRPISEHVTDRGKEFIKNFIKDLGIGVVSDVVDKVKNQNKDETFSHVDRSDKGSHLEHFYGVSGTDHSSSIISTDSDFETNLSCSDKKILSNSSTRKKHSAISDRGTHLFISERNTHSVSSNKMIHSVSSDRSSDSFSSDIIIHSTSSDKTTQSGSSDRCTSSSSNDRIAHSDSIDSSAKSDKDTIVAISCSDNDTDWNLDKYPAKPKYNPLPRPSKEMTPTTTLPDLPESTEATNARFRFVSKKWFLKMIVEFKMIEEKKPNKKKIGYKSEIIEVPMDAKDVKVHFQVFGINIMKWSDVKKWNRFENKWYDEPHIFRYETPPEQRVFTLGGSLFYEGVINVTDEQHDDVNDM